MQLGYTKRNKEKRSADDNVCVFLCRDTGSDQPDGATWIAAHGILQNVLFLIVLCSETAYDRNKKQKRKISREMRRKNCEAGEKML